jgi:hypothetical protein
MYLTQGSVWAVAFLLGTAGGGADSSGNQPTERTLETIRDCMSRAPAPWSQGWQAEYLDAIRLAITTDANSYNDDDRTACLNVLAKGFESYWPSLKKGEDRPLFELQLAQIRWYAEALFSAGLAKDSDRQKLRDQYKALCDDAAAALMTQFPFLDPNTVQHAKDDSLAECYHKIEAPLLPVFLHPLTDAHLKMLQQAWQNQQYSRVDLWWQIVDSERAGQKTSPSALHPHYLLTQRSLNQLLSQVWTVTVSPPDYCKAAMANRQDAERRLFRARSQALTLEKRLERERSSQVLQAEEIGFLLRALVETATDRPPAVQENSRHDPNDMARN